MMAGVPSPRYRVNRPLVISEVFDDEVVIVNFDDGTYYSLAGSGVAVWEAIEVGHDTDGIVRYVAGRHAAADEEVDIPVRELLARLEGERLIELDANGAGPAAPADAGPPEQPRPFSAPVLEIYTDMQELLLLDPIHEVDDGGWPRRKPE
jgi:hypothetical protein